MLYLLAIICPPLAVLLVGRPFQALLNVGLWALFVVPGIIHAVLVVNEKKADRRMAKQAKLISNAQKPS